MKTRYIFIVSILFLTGFVLVSCDPNDQRTREPVLDEYIQYQNGGLERLQKYFKALNAASVSFEQVYEYESGNDLKLEVKKSRKLQHQTIGDIEDVSKVLLREILYNLYTPETFTQLFIVFKNTPDVEEKEIEFVYKIEDELNTVYGNESTEIYSAYEHLEKAKSSLANYEDRKAMYHLNQAILLDYYLEEALVLRADLHMKNERFYDAMYDFTELINIDSTNSDYYLGSGIAHLETEYYNDAITQLKKCILHSTDNRNPEPYLHRGKAYFYNGQYYNAKKDLTKALGLEPELAEAYFFRGKVHTENGDREEACDDYENAAKYGYEDSELREQNAACYFMNLNKN